MFVLHYYDFIMLNFMCLIIIMSISVKRHKLWCTVRDMRLSKCSIIIIIIIIIDVVSTVLLSVGSGV